MRGTLSAGRGRDHVGADLVPRRQRDQPAHHRLADRPARPQAPLHPGHRGVHAHLGRGGRGARAWPSSSIARFLQGLAGGPLVPLSQATMIETFPARQRGMAMAIWGIGIMFAPIIGPTLGGWITDNWSWRWVFYINVPVGAAAVVMAWLFLPDSADGAAGGAARGRARPRPARGRRLRAAVRARPRPARGLVRLVADRVAQRDRGGGAGRARRARAPRGGAGGGPARAAPPDVRGGDGRHVRHQHRVLRDHGALAALHPDPHGLHGDAGGDGAGAGRRGHAGHDADRRRAA